jgi:hypothetical protein
MKAEDLEEPGPALTLNEVERLEKEFGFDLPQDYCGFLLKTNGGVVPELDGYFYLEAGDWWNHVHLFYGLKLPETPSIEIMSVLRRLMEQHPELFNPSSGKLPIASDYYGNKLYISLGGRERGSVYFWMHDGDVPDDKLSSSFQEFFELLREKPSKFERPDLYR